MPGTRLGGAKAAKTNLLRHGKDFYRDIGRLGGSHGTTGGFYANRELAKEMGRRAGKISKRGLSFIKRRGNKYYYEDSITGKIVVCKYDKKTDKIVRIGGNNEEE